jgi:hypothetical protein
MSDQRRAADRLTPVHEHRFQVVNPYQPEAARCVCGMYRFEIMGPIAKAQARSRLYGRRWAEFPR